MVEGITKKAGRSTEGGGPSTVPVTQGVPARGSFPKIRFIWVCAQKIASGISFCLSFHCGTRTASCLGPKEELSWDPESKGDVCPGAATSREDITGVGRPLPQESEHPGSRLALSHEPATRASHVTLSFPPPVK